MRTPIYVRPPTDAEREILAAGLHSSDAFVPRRGQIILESAERKLAPEIAEHLHCHADTVRNAIHAFNTRGVATLQAGSSTPHTIHVAFSDSQSERLRAVLHQSPRTFGKPTSLWTLELAAEVRFERGLTPARVSGETIRATLARVGVRWQRAKRWITSPDPEYTRKKHARDHLIRLAAAHPDWALGFEDETWWSRLAMPALRAWADAWQPIHLVEQTVAKDDPDPKALACYGLLGSTLANPQDVTEQVWLRFVKGRPVSSITTQFLEWCCAKLEALDKRVLLLVWDNASWHISREVREWIREHNREVKHTGHGVRLLSCYLPIKGPWLNPIEPHWIHAKRKVAEPARLLVARELRERIFDHFGCAQEEFLAIPEKVA